MLKLGKPRNRILRPALAGRVAKENIKEKMARKKALFTNPRLRDQRLVMMMRKSMKTSDYPISLKKQIMNSVLKKKEKKKSLDTSVIRYSETV